MLYGTSARQELNLPDGLTLDRLAGIRQQTLLMYGENSPSLSSLHGLRQHLPASRSVVVTGAGHFFPLSRAKFFVAVAERFLEMVCKNERRLYERVPCSFLVGIREKGAERFTAEVLNISGQGLLLKSSRKLEIGRNVKIITGLSHDYDISTEGRIVRAMHDNDGERLLGIELDLHEDAGLVWNSLLAEKLGTSLADILPNGT
jgi:hypothetical protein